MHTQEWLNEVRRWMTEAWSEGNLTLFNSLFSALRELSFVLWCEAGRNPKEWSSS